MIEREESSTGERPLRALGAAVLLVGACLAACAPAPERERRIEHTRVRTVVGDDRPWGAGPAERFGLRAPTSPAAAAADDGIAWSTPAGWTERPPGAMRALDFAVGEGGECYLTLLAGDGGGLEANVQRWRGQMGLAPATPAELRALPVVPFFGGEGVLVDFEGTWSEERPDHRLLGVLAVDGGAARFLKFVGPSALVAAEREAFLALARSLRAGTPAASARSETGDTPPPALQRAAGLAWDVPAGWTRAPERPFRVVTFTAGPEALECYVTLLSGDGGGVGANVERWRSQLGANGATARELQRTSVTVLDGEAELVLLTGALQHEGELVDPAAMLGLIRLLPGQAVFVKMTGPLAAVEQQRSAFESFVRSLREDG